jgi:hypothetical protein
MCLLGPNGFNGRSTLKVGGESYEIFRWKTLERAGVGVVWPLRGQRAEAAGREGGGCAEL